MKPIKLLFATVSLGSLLLLGACAPETTEPPATPPAPAPTPAPVPAPTPAPANP